MEITYQGLRIQLPFEGVIGIESFSMDASFNEHVSVELGLLVEEETIEQNEVSKTYSFPKSYVSYRKPRTVSTEQREWERQMMIAKTILNVLGVSRQPSGLKHTNVISL